MTAKLSPAFFGDKKLTQVIIHNNIFNYIIQAIY
jgi:hypothetical protein